MLACIEEYTGSILYIYMHRSQSGVGFLTLYDTGSRVFDRNENLPLDRTTEVSSLLYLQPRVQIRLSVMHKVSLPCCPETQNPPRREHIGYSNSAVSHE